MVAILKDDVPPLWTVQEWLAKFKRERKNFEGLDVLHLPLARETFGDEWRVIDYKSLFHTQSMNFSIHPRVYELEPGNFEAKSIT